VKKLQQLFIFLIIIHSLQAKAQGPDLSRIPEEKLKIKAWLNYCDSLRNNNPTAANYPILQQAGLRGVELVPQNDPEDRSRFYLYAAIGSYYQLKFDTAQYFFYQSLLAGQQANSAQRIVAACIALIPVNFQMGQPDKVESCKNILQAVADTSKDKSILQDCYYALGSYYQQRSYYSTAQDYFIKSIELREPYVDTTKEIKKKFDYAIQRDMLSKLYLNTQMPDKSLNSLRQARRFLSVSPIVEARLLSSFVEAFTISGNIDSALYYNSLLEEHTRNNPMFPSEIVTSNLNIAIYYIDHLQYGQALPYINKADSINIQVKSPILIFQMDMIKGRYFEGIGKYDQAIGFLTLAIPIARQYGKELYSDVLKYMAIAQKGKGNNLAAVQYYEQYVQQSDSITKEKLSRNFADQETRYQTNQKEQQIASLDKENRVHVLELQNASRTRLLLVLGLAALGVIALLLYFIYRNKEKLNKVLNLQNERLEELNAALATANETKAKLFGIIGHDLRSPVSQIVQLLRLQKEKPELLSPQSRQKHEERLKTASENVLETMEDLLLWSKSQMQQFTPQFNEVVVLEILKKELSLLEQQIQDKNIKIDLQVGDQLIRQTDDNFLSIIIRNLLQNAIKYSDPGSVISISTNGKNICVSNPSSQTDAESLNAVLSNGKVDSKTSGLGLQIAGDLATSIRAKLFFKRLENMLTAVLSWEI
jgi:signal transduction histidine kinase